MDDDDRKNAFWRALESDDIEQVRQILEENPEMLVSVQRADEYEISPMEVVIDHHNAEMGELLIEKAKKNKIALDLNRVNRYSMSYLRQAAFLGDVAMVTLLLDNGVRDRQLTNDIYNNPQINPAIYVAFYKTETLASQAALIDKVLDDPYAQQKLNQLFQAGIILPPLPEKTMEKLEKLDFVKNYDQGVVTGVLAGYDEKNHRAIINTRDHLAVINIADMKIPNDYINEIRPNVQFDYDLSRQLAFPLSARLYEQKKLEEAEKRYEQQLQRGSRAADSLSLS